MEAKLPNTIVLQIGDKYYAIPKELADKYVITKKAYAELQTPDVEGQGHVDASHANCTAHVVWQASCG